MNETITTTRAVDAHERTEVVCPGCGRAMRQGMVCVTFFDEAGYYSPAPKTMTIWRCGCGRSMQLWEGKTA